MVIVNKNYRFVQIHIPKTGGTSIKSFFPTNDNKFIKLNKHISASDLQNKINWHDFVSFSVVRNPYDRMVSAYKYCIQTNVIAKKISFEQFVNLVCKNKRNIKDVPHICRIPQLCYLTNNNKPIGQIIVNHILRFENLQQDRLNLCTILKLEEKFHKLPHLLKTNHKHYSTYYNNQIRQIVKDYFNTDIVYFNYKFEKE